MDNAESAYCILNDQYTDNSSFIGLRSNITRNSVLNWIFDTAKNAYYIRNDQYTDNSRVFENQTKKRLKAQIIKKLVTISCFRFFKIFSQSYIFIFALKLEFIHLSTVDVV